MQESSKESTFSSNLEFEFYFPKLFSCIKVFRKEKSPLRDIKNEVKKLEKKKERKGEND